MMRRLLLLVSLVGALLGAALSVAAPAWADTPAPGPNPTATPGPPTSLQYKVSVTSYSTNAAGTVTPQTPFTDVLTVDCSSRPCSIQAFAAMTMELRTVADECCGGRIALVTEGGYDLQTLGDSIDAAVAALSAPAGPAAWPTADRPGSTRGRASADAAKAAMGRILERAGEYARPTLPWALTVSGPGAGRGRPPGRPRPGERRRRRR